MKFRDPKTGKVFDSIYEAYKKFCNGRLCKWNTPESCVIAKNKTTADCIIWVSAHQDEAARLMGYEVIREAGDLGESGTGPDNPGAPGPNWVAPWEKPRLAEVLGVEEDEIWVVEGGNLMYRVHDGMVEFRVDKSEQWRMCLHTPFIFDIINHPESIIRAPRLTEAELAICKPVGAKWVSIDDGEDLYVKLWYARPSKMNGEYYMENGKVSLAKIIIDLFPSVRPGDCICVEEAGGDA